MKCIRPYYITTISHSGTKMNNKYELEPLARPGYSIVIMHKLTIKPTNLFELFNCRQAPLFTPGSEENVTVKLPIQALDNGEANALV